MPSMPLNRRRFLGRALGAIGLLLLPVGVGQGHATEPYPSRPVRIIVPYPPGGTTDIVARIIAQQLSEQLGRPFVVDNRAGASGAIGASAVAKSAPDGYTLLMGTANSHGINSALQANLPYDAVKDFAPITVVASTPNVVIVNAKLPVRSLAELLALAKADPGKLNYGSTSPGGSPHMSAELLQAMTGTRMTHVPYKGAAPMLTDLVAGTIQVGFDNLPSSMGMIQSGDVRALAVTTPERWPGTPDLPTVAESGVPEYEVSGWFGLLAPAGTPAAIVERIQAAVAEAVRKPGVREQFAAAGARPVADQPDVFARQIAADVERWKKVVQTTGVRLE